jgi:hypothetical protein
MEPLSGSTFNLNIIFENLIKENYETFTDTYQQCAHLEIKFLFVVCIMFLATDPEAQVRFPALPDFRGGGKENSSGSGTGFTQPREYN